MKSKLKIVSVLRMMVPVRKWFTKCIRAADCSLCQLCYTYSSVLLKPHSNIWKMNAGC